MQTEKLGRTQHTTKYPLTFSHGSQPHAEHPERNEDAVLIDRKRGMAAVFDGVGGHADGDVASQTAARVLKSGWKRVVASVQTETNLLIGEQQIDIPVVMSDLLHLANERIHEQGEKKREEDGSEKIVCGGTTAVFVVFCINMEGHGYFLHYAHVGDSRIYLLPKGEGLRRLTIDDGYFTREVGKGLLTEQDSQRIEQVSVAEELTDEDRVHYEMRNGITQALGDAKIQVHLGRVAVSSGDRILLCSDGIHDNLTDQEIEEVLRKAARTTVAKALLRRATERSQQEHLRAKKDDISCIIISCS